MAAMGRRARHDSYEEDAYSSFGRRYLTWAPGVLAAIKRKTHKRERREGTLDAMYRELDRHQGVDDPD